MFNEGRIFLAELGKAILNRQMYFEVLYLPENIFDWVAEKLTEEADGQMNEDVKQNLIKVQKPGKHFISLGLNIYKHYGPTIFSFVQGHFIEIHIEEKTRKILSCKFIGPERIRTIPV